MSMRTSAAPLLEVTDLRRYFGGRGSDRRGAIRAVENVSFTVRPAKRWDWSARAGAGKSTTGRMIVGLEIPLPDRSMFRGENLAGLSPKEWRTKRREIFRSSFKTPNRPLIRD